MSDDVVTREIEELIHLAKVGPVRVSRDKLHSWMRSSDLEVVGAAYVLLTEAGPKLRVEPELESGEVVLFCRRYLERCMKEGGEGPWSLTRHGAGWELAHWIAQLADNPATPRDAILELRDWIASLYRNGSREDRDVLVNAVLEHLFERAELRRLFESWKTDPILSRAYDDAVLWVRNCGDSPIVGRGKSKKSRKGN